MLMPIPMLNMELTSLIVETGLVPTSQSGCWATATSLTISTSSNHGLNPAETAATEKPTQPRSTKDEGNK